MNTLITTLLYVVLVSLSSLVLSSITTHTTCNISKVDYIALQDLFISTNGSNWDSRCNSNWIFPSNTSTIDYTLTCRDWYGIICNSQCQVIELLLNFCNLEGTIPSSIGTFVNLTFLSFQSNQLTGSIPSSIDNLVNLQYLTLANNQLSTISTPMWNLVKLEELYLSYNQLNGSIPSSIGNLVNLIGLYLSNNQLSGTIPSSIGNLVNLTYLGLQSNQLSGTIPSSIGNLIKVQTLYLSNNQLNGSIPLSVGNLANLTYLYLFNNQLSGSIPSLIGNLVKLQVLYINFNQFSGTIPLSIGNLVKLQVLELNNNQLSGTIPSSIGNLVKLTYLYLFNNQLSGSIPSSIGNLVKLTQLFLYSNQLTGTIPLIGSLTKLIALDLHYNQLSGTIPSSIGKFVNLQKFYLYNNQFSGTIPSSIGSLVNLTYLALDNNQLSGSIPSSIGNLVTLTYLYLYSNQLSGSIPSSIGNLVKLKFLSLYSNQLTGTIPSSIENMQKLTVLLVYENRLTGSIPFNQLCNMSLLQIVQLQNNLLTGTVSCIFSLPSVQAINLSNNTKLTGNLSSLITSSSSRELQYIFLGNMNLYGSIPDSLFNLTNLISLVLSSNCITGAIPESICNSTTTSRWSLIVNEAFSDSQCSKNSRQFSGSLPSCIFASPNLTTLHLAGNRLVGQLPDISMNSSIQDLNLASNLLTGDIPVSIQLYDRFTKVDLSGSKLSGTLADTYQPPSESIDMSNNHLSGSPPLILRATNSSVNVVSGNLFGCPLLPTDVANSGTSDVFCGSETFDKSVYTWLSVALISLFTLVLSISVCNSSSVIRVTNLVLVWMKASHHHLPLSSTSNRSQLPNSLLHTIRAVKLLEDVSSVSLILLAMFLLVVMMTYVGMKLHRINSVYQVQYLYTVTAAFFTGNRPAVVIWIFVVLSGAVVGTLCVRSYPIEESSSVSTHRINDVKSDTAVYQEYQDSVKALVLQLTVTIVIVAVAFAINYGFVKIVYFDQPSNLSAIQFGFAAIKNIFSSIVVPFSSKLIRREYRSIYSVAMKVTVTTAAPAVAILVNSPLCLHNFLFPRSITDTYMSFTYTAFVLGSTPVVVLSPGPVSTSFNPPWNYSYQCSSSFLVSYLQTFVYMYTINGIIVPLIYLMMITSLSRRGSYPFLDHLLDITGLGDKSPYSSIFTISDNSKEISSISSSQVELSAISKPVHHNDMNDSSGSDYTIKSPNNTSISTSTSTSSSTSNKYDFEISDLVPGLCVDITLLLTFGLASPLLAIPISFSIIINTLLLRLALGRYIVIVSSAIGQASCFQKLEDTFRDARKGLSDSWGIMSLFIGLFWALFVNDMIGDMNPMGGVIAAVMMIITCPLVFISLQLVLSYINTDSNSNSSSKSYNYKYSDAIERASQSVHMKIWIFIHTILMMKDMINTDTDTNSNINSNDNDNRESSMIDTISPLRTINKY